MGIRINTMLGFGLTDVESKDGIITDDRFNPNSFLFNHDNVFLYDDFLKYLYGRMEEEQMTNNGRHNVNSFNLKLLVQQIEQMFNGGKTLLSFYKAINYDGEFGLSQVLHVVPPTYPGWIRYDDNLDYYLFDAATSTPPNATMQDGSSWVKVLTRPIYPFDGYINAKTGERLIGEHLNSMWLINHMAARVSPTELNLMHKELFEQEFGVPDYNEYKNFIVPMIPVEVIELLTFLKIFKDPIIINQLRPQLYCYWS